MSRALVILDSRFQRQKAADWCWSLKDGTRCEFKAPKRTDDQNAKMWVLLSELATQTKHHGIKLTPDDWKLLFLDALKREVRMVPNLDGNGIVSLGRSSSDLSKQEMSDLIELIYEFGARNAVTFNEPASDHPPSKSGSETAGSASENPTSPGPSDDATDPAMPVEAGAEGQEQSEPAPASEDFTATEWKWLRECGPMLWAFAFTGEIGRVQAAAKSVSVPSFIGQPAKDKLRAFTKICIEVADGEDAKPRRQIAAMHLGVTEDELKGVEP